MSTVHSNQSFASFCNGKILSMAKHKSRQIAVGWKEGKCQRGATSRRSTKARRRSLLISPGFLWLLYCCEAKYFSLYKAQHEVCVQVLHLPYSPWRINYRWGNWWWKISVTVRVKQQDRIGGVEQEISAMASMERKTCFRELNGESFPSEQRKKSGQFPEKQIQHQRPNWVAQADALQAESDQDVWQYSCMYRSSKHLPPSIPKSNPLLPAVLPRRKERRQHNSSWTHPFIRFWKGFSYSDHEHMIKLYKKHMRLWKKNSRKN